MSRGHQISLAILACCLTLVGSKLFADPQKLQFSSTALETSKNGHHVKWNQPEDPAELSPPYNVLLTGTTDPTVLVIAKDRKPIAANRSGDFKLRFNLTEPKMETRVQFIFPDGEVLNFNVVVEIIPPDPVKPLTETEPLAPTTADDPDKVMADVAKPSIDSEDMISDRKTFFFGLEENGVQLQDPTLEYEFANDGSFRIGNAVFDADLVDLTLVKNKKYELQTSWQRKFVPNGKIVLKAKDKVLESKKIDDGDIQKDKGRRLHVFYKFELSEKDLANYQKMNPVRMCLFKSYEKDMSAGFCSAKYNITGDAKSGYGLEVQKASITEPRVLVAGKAANSKGSITPQKDNLKISINTQLPTGNMIHIETAPSDPGYYDVVSGDSEKTAIISGTGQHPLGSKVAIARSFWRAPVPLNQGSLYYPGIGGFPLKQSIGFSKKLPTEKLRPKVEPPLHRSTTTKHAKAHFSLDNELKPSKIFSSEWKVLRHNHNYFDWDSMAKEKGRYNRSHILVTLNDDRYPDEYSAYTNVYGGYPFELSGKISALSATSSNIFVGEFDGTAWIEQLFNWESRGLSVQRWGVSAKYLKSLNSGTDIYGNPITLTCLNVDLKYRLTQGVWLHDPVFGASLGYQSVTYSSYLGTMAGVGAFVGMPMPLFLDNLINFFSWLRYPKWIESEFQYYFMPLSSITLGTNYNVFLRAKIFPKPNFFFEGAVGLKQFAYSDTAGSYTIGVGAFMSTIGLGLEF